MEYENLQTMRQSSRGGTSGTVIVTFPSVSSKFWARGLPEKKEAEIRSMKNPFSRWSEKDSALLRSSTRCAQYEKQQGMQYFISQVAIIARTFRNKLKNTLTEIEVQTVTFIETKNNFADWVCDLGWKVRCIPKKKDQSGERALFYSMSGVQR